MSRILLIDNYDSFVHNLARYFQRLGQQPLVVRNDAIDVDAIGRLHPSAIVLSPGPCGPQQAGISVEVVQRLHAEVPLLGVCLGHQAICAALGGRVIHAPQPVHGRASIIHHDGRDVFEGLPDPLAVGRYHSLVAEESSLPECLEVAARADDGCVMAVRHRRLPVVGLQFHPESILTEHGFPMLAAFLRLAGIEAARPLPALESELGRPTSEALRPSGTPVTF